jgi:putative membrane protein
MKRLYFTFMPLLGVLLLIAGTSYGKEGRTGTTGDTFLNKAIEMNQAELEISRMAQGKAENPEVKEYADMMVRDHTEALEKLRSAANVSESQVPLTKGHQETYDKLARMTGVQFDTEYMSAMVRDHREAVQTFQHEAENTDRGATTQRQKPGTAAGTNDAAIAREMLPTLQKHLSAAEQLTKGLGDSSTK